jgi:nitroreductase
MNVFDAIKSRRSIRGFKNKLVEKNKILKIIEAARLSPSAANRQPWRFLVIDNPELKNKLAAAYNSDWFISAPVIIIACALPNQAWIRRDGEEYWKIDIAIAVQDIVLAAWELGFGTCWVGAFSEKAVKELLNIPENVRVVAMIPLGYPKAEKGNVINRKSFEEICSFNKW